MIETAIQSWRPYALLALLCLGLYVPGLVSLPVTDRDEARFAQASRQMLESRDFVTIRFQDEARNKKPAGIYWLQAASVALLSNAESNAIWPYRLPSLLGALAASLLSFGMGVALVGRKAAFLGAASLAMSLGLVIEAHLAKTDAVLLASISAAQLALARLYLAARARTIGDWRFAFVFWSALGLGVLVKGPVAPAVSALTVAALSIADRDLRWLESLRPVRGMVLLAALTLPWLIAISRATHGAFLSQSLGTDFLGKIVGAQESHGAPPLYYLALLAFLFWPGALFLGPAIAWAAKNWHEPAERFLIAWAVPFWIVLELVPTKLPNYLLPVYPALALLIGRALDAAGEGRFQSWRWLDRGISLLWALASLGLAIVFIVVPIRFGGDVAPGLVAAAIVLYLAARLLFGFWRRVGPYMVGRAAVLALLVLPLAFGFIAPRLGRLWLSRSAAVMVARDAAIKSASVATAGYAEPSLVFMLGTKTMLVDAARAARHLTTGPSTLALVEGREDDAFRRDLAGLGWAPHLLGATVGLDYSNGRPMVLRLYSGAKQ